MNYNDILSLKAKFNKPFNLYICVVVAFMYQFTLILFKVNITLSSTKSLQFYVLMHSQVEVLKYFNGWKALMFLYC
jgi:hypothetical protein